MAAKHADETRRTYASRVGMSARATKAVPVFEALSDPTRLWIFETLQRNRCPVGALAELLGLSQPTLSYHLKILEGAGLVNGHRHGQKVIYEINDWARRWWKAVGEAIDQREG